MKLKIVKWVLLLLPILLVTYFSMDIEEMVYNKRIDLIELEQKGLTTTSQEVWLEILTHYVGIAFSITYIFLYSLISLAFNAGKFVRVIGLSLLGAEITDGR